MTGKDAVAEHRSFCRTCSNWCAVKVRTSGGQVLEVVGDHDNPVYHGYTCTKGRAHASMYGHPERLVAPLRRNADGSRESVSIDAAIDDIGARLLHLRDRHGPRSIGIYQGTYLYLDHPANVAMADAFMRALGSPMSFSTASIDQAGKPVAAAKHGMWMAPGRGALDPDVVLMVGMNPLISHTTWPGNPGRFFAELADRGASLLVIDPRRTETARRARIHLQCHPGHDVALLAAMINVILAEGLIDDGFVTENVDGLAALRSQISRFDPVLVAEDAGVSAEELVEAARIFGRARRAHAVAGTGPSMSGRTTLIEYLVLCIQTICGQWARAGDPVPNALTLAPAYSRPHVAQAIPPFPGYGFGEPSRVRGLGQIASGMPTAAAADEMLLEGPGQVRALLSLGGNPAAAWPDQKRTLAGLRALDLLVQTDVMIGATARLAHYTMAMAMPYEMAGSTLPADLLALFVESLGSRRSYAQYTPAIVERPDGVLTHAEFIFKLAQRMDLQLDVFPGLGSAIPGGTAVSLDMSRDLDMEHLFEVVHAGSRVPLAEVMRHEGGDLYPHPAVTVAPRQADWPGRLQVADPEMMSDLADHPIGDPGDPEYPFRLISRRMPHVFNSPTLALPRNRPPYNPAYLHPMDLEDLGIKPEDEVAITSARATITATVRADPTVRSGVVSMSHSWGGPDGADADDRLPGVSTGRLVDNARQFDRYTGQPRMSDVPVRVTALLPAGG